MPDHQLQLALQVASSGADAMRYAALAIGAFPDVWVSPNFAYNAVTRPLEALADLLGAPPPARPAVSTCLAQQLPAKAKATTPVRRRQVKKRTTLSSIAKVIGFPAPPDLKGFDLRANLYGIEPNSVLESAACRALLLEVVRRAAYDWVLYRASSKLVNRQLAESAHTWLFVEKPDTATWDLRRRNGKELTGFVAICDLIEIDPEKMRATIRTMTERDIMGAGRPAERRKNKGGDDTMHADDLPVFDVDVDNLPVHDPLYSNYSMEG